MSSYGWTNDDTHGAAGACDNTQAFAPRLSEIIDLARAGHVDAAAQRLRTAAETDPALTQTLPSWVNLDRVNWSELVTAWADDE